MYCYAQLDENNICFAVTEHNMPINGDNIIELPSATYNVLGKKYEEGKWIDNEILPQPTQLDRIEEQQLILMEAQAEQYEQNLENRLNDIEVQATLYEAILALGGEV